MVFRLLPPASSALPEGSTSSASEAEKRPVCKIYQSEVAKSMLREFYHLLVLSFSSPFYSWEEGCTCMRV